MYSYIGCDYGGVLYKSRKVVLYIDITLAVAMVEGNLLLYKSRKVVLYIQLHCLLLWWSGTTCCTKVGRFCYMYSYIGCGYGGV